VSAKAQQDKEEKAQKDMAVAASANKKRPAPSDDEGDRPARRVKSSEISAAIPVISSSTSHQPPQTSAINESCR